MGLALAGFFLVLEAGLRVCGYAPSQWARVGYINSPFVPSDIPGVWQEMRAFHHWAHIFPSNVGGYFEAGNTVWYQTNNAGYRGRDFFREKFPESGRIAFLGDSLGFGFGVKDEDVVTTLLESQLNQLSGRPIEVYNFAVEGYSTADEAALLEHRVLRYQPDLIIVWYFLNDVETDGPAPLRPLFLPSLRPYSRLMAFVGARMDLLVTHYLTIWRYHEAYQDSDKRWIATKHHLQRMAALAQDRGIPIYLFIHPILFHLGRYPFADIHRKVLATAWEYGFQAYDLLEVFRRREAEALWVHPQDHHPNAEGHRLAAQYVARILSQTPSLISTSLGDGTNSHDAKD